MYLKTTKEDSAAATTSRKAMAEQTREKVLDAAMRLMAEKGYSQTRLEEVAKNLQMTRGAIYGHFKSKAQLYEEILKYSQEPLYTVLRRSLNSSADALTTIRTFMNEWISLLSLDDRHRYSTEIFLNKSEMIPEVENVFRKEIKLTEDVIAGLQKVFERGVAAKEFSLNIDARMAAIHVYSYLMGLMQAWLFNPSLYDLGEQAPKLIDGFIDGFISRNPSLKKRKGLR